MRVLMTTDTIGGVWTYTMDLIKGLERYNVEVVLATLGDPLSASQLAQVRRLKRVSLHTSNYRLEWMHDPWKDLDRAQRWVLQLNFTFNPDVIHFNSYAFDARLFNVPVIMTGHSCVLSWWKAVKNEPAPKEWQPYADLVKRGLHNADIVVAPSYTMMNALVENYGAFANSHVIYNSGDESFFNPGKKEKIIFCMGRLWDEAKNVQLLLEAAKTINYPVFIAGDARKSMPLSASSNVHFLGKLDKKNIARWLSISSVYTLPALYEPFGLSVLEAAYSGCALMLGKIQSLQEIWKDNAIYCDPHNHQELANQLNNLMENDELRSKMANMAIKRSADFKLGGMAGAYFALYNSISGSNRKRTGQSRPATVKTRL